MSKEKNDQPDNSDAQAMELIKGSGLLTPSFSLEKLMSLTARLSAVELAGGGPAALYSWTFISRHFIYKGTQKN